jgi:hypothetical protein
MSRKLGRRAPKKSPALRFSQFWSGAVPDHPDAVDYLARLQNWQMLGNNDFGDCVAVAAANLRRLISSQLGLEDYPTQDEVFALYRTQNPNFQPNPNRPVEDNGMDIQTMLEYWHGNEWSGTKVVAFAAVDPTNLAELKAAIAIFGGVLPGVLVTQANDQEFSNGQPWDFVKRSRTLGGHCILGGGYQSTTSGAMRFITWAKETQFTEAFIAHQFEECWIPIFPEHLGTKSFQQGVDLLALAAAYRDLTGKPLPVPTPVPVPDPVPVPSGAWVIESQTDSQIVLNRIPAPSGMGEESVQCGLSPNSESAGVRNYPAFPRGRAGDDYRRS